MPEEIILPAPNPFKERPWIILSSYLIFLILVLLGFNFALDKYGRFWESSK